MLNKATLKIKNMNETVNKIYSFSEQFKTFNIYDSCQVSAPLGYNRFNLVAGFGCVSILEGSFQDISLQIDTSKYWIFGQINYEGKNEFSTDSDATQSFFYTPEIVITLIDAEFQIINNGISDILFNQYLKFFVDIDLSNFNSSKLAHTTTFMPSVLKDVYLNNVDKIKEDILNGVYYEMNYCQKFTANISLSAQEISYLQTKMLNQSPAPFSAYLNLHKTKLLCASPERFLMRDGQKLISQPIKGTNKRLIGEANNEQLNILKQSEKELAENVMIVDLVRNDLTKVCKTGTIKVEELCGTYAFSKVNQMISTVTGQLQEKESFFEIMQALFPMGSMTGAPKIEVIKNIELFEQTKRGLYSGCVGYIMPNKDFDFNVVIRTLVIEENQIHFHVGGAITFDSEAEKEFEECLLKGNSITDLFEE